jgi:hypothetical protein
MVQTLTLRERLTRAFLMLGGGIAVAAIALPIPLVHLVLIPGALLLGLVFAILRIRQRTVIRSAEGTCPYCGTPQRLGVAGRVFRLPRKVFCRSCRRGLVLGDEGTDQVAE